MRTWYLRLKDSCDNCVCQYRLRPVTHCETGSSSTIIYSEHGFREYEQCQTLKYPVEYCGVAITVVAFDLILRVETLRCLIIAVSPSWCFERKAGF